MFSKAEDINVVYITNTTPTYTLNKNSCMFNIIPLSEYMLSKTRNSQIPTKVDKLLKIDEMRDRKSMNLGGDELGGIGFEERICSKYIV